jgi:site-specific DNA recombinase
MRKLFAWYATGNCSLLQVRNMAGGFMEIQGLAFQYAKRLPKSTVEHILKNPVYYGDFLWDGKLYRGSHPPVISRGLWEKTQEAFRKTNHPMA